MSCCITYFGFVNTSLSQFHLDERQFPSLSSAKQIRMVRKNDIASSLVSSGVSNGVLHLSFIDYPMDSPLDFSSCCSTFTATEKKIKIYINCVTQPSFIYCKGSLKFVFKHKRNLIKCFKLNG